MNTTGQKIKSEIYTKTVCSDETKSDFFTEYRWVVDAYSLVKGEAAVYVGVGTSYDACQVAISSVTAVAINTTGVYDHHGNFKLFSDMG